jgi:serine/threonine protein phosphatase PrpC
MVLDNTWAVAIIADGLGAAKHSDIGSYLAVNTVGQHISENCPKKWNVPKLTTLMREAFERALNDIKSKSVMENNAIFDYDTTLTALIYNGSQVVFGHVGDGGIITLSKHGNFSRLTRVQKGHEFNMVSPLRSCDKWVFGSSDNDICAVSLLTDGIYDVICPWILDSEKQPIYVNYIRPFMDRNLLKAKTSGDFEKVRREIKDFLNSPYNAKITDDKTIAVIINLGVVPTVKPDEYYAEPDWEGLQNERKKRLYDTHTL